MAKIIINEGLSLEQIKERRLTDDFNRSPAERLKKGFRLMRLSKLFSKNKEIKKGIIIKDQSGFIR